MKGAGKAIRVYGLCAVVLLAIWLVRAVLAMPVEPGGLTGVVDAAMPQSGVKHPVTAVLLNFRGYDTWLELGVLLLAAMGVLLFQPRNDLTAVRPLPPFDPVLTRAAVILFPFAVLVSGYLLWVGKYAPGGAFQAGVVLGSVVILLWLTGIRLPAPLIGRWFAPLLAVGFASFMAVAAVLGFIGREFLAYPPEQAGNLILLIESCATLSIAATMAALIVGLRTQAQHAEESPHG